MQDIDSHQYNIEDFSDDDNDIFNQIAEDAFQIASEIVNAQESPKPKPLKIVTSKKSPENESRPANTIQNFFAKPSISNSTENQEKRTRSLIDCLENDFCRKSPAKVQRKSKSPEEKTSISLVDRSLCVEKKKEVHIEEKVILVDDSESDQKESQEDNEYKTESSNNDDDLLVYPDSESEIDKVGSDENINASKSDDSIECKTTEIKSPTKVRQSKLFDYFAKDANTASCSNQTMPTKSVSESASKDSEDMEVDLLTDDESQNSINAETDQLKSLHVASDPEPASQEIDKLINCDKIH